MISLEGDIIPALLDRKSSMYGFRHSGSFIDIGLPADYRRAGGVLDPARTSISRNRQGNSRWLMPQQC